MNLVFDGRAELGEGPVWDESSQSLYWLDLFLGHVHRYDTKSKKDSFIKMDEIIGCLTLRKRGGLLVATESGVYAIDFFKETKLRISDIEADKPEKHFNDGKIDPIGRFWFGSIAIDRTTTIMGNLYSLEKDLSVVCRLSDIDNTNGMDWSPDFRTFYHVDSLSKEVTAYNYQIDSGNISQPRSVVRLPDDTAVPDGITVSKDGNLWVAHWGGGCVTRWDPKHGKLLETFKVPAKLTTSCAFGGPKMNELYITTARYQQSIEDLEKHPLSGGIFKIKTDTEGFLPRAFEG